MELRPEQRSEIATRFRELRRVACMTQSQLGEIIGLSRQSVSEIENCRVTLHLSSWKRFRTREAKQQQWPSLRDLREW
jgi:hypothetical protein